MLYAHALVAAPRLALAWLAPIARWLGDPRLDMTGMFLSVSRVLPNQYPLEGELDDYIADEHAVGRLLDVGVIAPRLTELYRWSADELRIPDVTDLVSDATPAYAWDPHDRNPGHPHRHASYAPSAGHSRPPLRSLAPVGPHFRIMAIFFAAYWVRRFSHQVLVPCRSVPSTISLVERRTRACAAEVDGGGTEIRSGVSAAGPSRRQVRSRGQVGRAGPTHRHALLTRQLAVVRTGSGSELPQPCRHLIRPRHTVVTRLQPQPRAPHGELCARPGLAG